MKTNNAPARTLTVTPSKPVTLYKDYNKDVKDLLTKSYSDAAKWKLECKFKGPKDTVFVNPTATSDGKFSADVEYIASQCGASVKANFTPAGDVKVTTVYNHQGHKVEASVDKNGKYEVSHECTLNGRLSSHAKLVQDSLEFGLGAPVAPHCHVGCGTTYLMKGKNTCEWSLSCRYANGNRVVAVRTNKLQTYTTSLLTPIPSCTHNVLVAAEVVCGRGQGWNGTLGLEAGCVVRKGNTIKARVNKNKEWALAYIAKLADNWTAAVTVDKNLKAGVLLTHS